MKRLAAGLLAGIAFLGQPAAAPAADFPVKGRTMSVVVPFPPGGASDLIGRLVAQKLGELWGVSAVVENRVCVSTRFDGCASTVIDGRLRHRPSPMLRAVGQR